MSEILLVRHGETEWNAEGRIQGYRADSPLTGIGRAQAQALARRIADESVDVLYSSDSGRTRQTVAPIAEATRLPVVLDASLRERNYGVFEGSTYAEVERDFPQAFERFGMHDPHFAAEGGESALQFRDRVIEALERLARQAEGGRAVVVTHGGVLGAMYRHVMNIPLDTPRSFGIANASLNRLSFHAGAWRVIAWGEVAHLSETRSEGL